MFHSLLFSPKLGCRSGRAACIDLLSNAAVWSNSIFQKVQYCPAETLLQHQNWLHEKRPFFYPIHGSGVPPSWGRSYIFSPPILGNSSLKLAFIVKKRVAWTAQKMSLGPGGEIRAELHMVMVLVVLGLHHTNPRSQVSTYLETTCN